MPNEDLKGKAGQGQGDQGQGSQGDHPEGKSAGGGKGESGEAGGDAGKGGEKSVSYESFQEVLKEKKSMQKKLAEYESKAKAEADAKMAADGKIQELLDQEKAAKAKAFDRLKMAELKFAATKSGMIDPDYLKILIDQVEFDAEGIPQNVDAFFASLKETKPHLFGQTDQAPGHENSGGKAWRPGGKYTEKQISEMSNEEFLKNFPDIQNQMKQGKIT